MSDPHSKHQQQLSVHHQLYIQSQPLLLLLIELCCRHIARNGEKGRRIHHRASQRHRHVARTGTAGGERRNRRVAHAEIGVGHMRGNLLVAGRYQLDPVARLVERIEHTDIAVPANSEHIRNLAGDEIFGDEIGALHLHVGFEPQVRAGIRRKL